MASAEDIVLDGGTYHVYQGDRALGAETFAFEQHGDSLFLHCQISETLPHPRGDRKLEKTMRLLVREFDLGLILYESIQHLDGEKLVRAIVPQDTAMMVYRETDRGGTGDVRVRPPGKIFILDGQVFSLFDLICRDLHGKTFTERPLQFYVLGARDTLVRATATDLGTETIRWDMKPTEARKIRFSDGSSDFIAWVAPHGVMLRLEQPISGLRVERKGQIGGVETVNRNDD